MLADEPTGIDIRIDEPTGALDSRAAQSLLELFEQINREGQTILMVTHSLRRPATPGGCCSSRTGRVFHQLYRGGQSQDKFYQRIADALTLLATGGRDHD